MSCIVYQTNKKTGVKYAYTSESYWDKEKQQPRSRRKYLGRVDPETGQIITGRSPKNNAEPDPSVSEEEVKKLKDTIKQQEATITSLREDISVLHEKYKNATVALSRIHSLSEITED